jgi:hypothetical protein
LLRKFSTQQAPAKHDPAMTALQRVSVTAAAVCAMIAGCPGTAAADTASSCTTGQVTVLGAQRMSPGLGHRGARVFFALAPDSAPCTLKGYPGVDSFGGEPVIHAQRTPNGYLGGLFPKGAPPPTVLLDGSHDAMAEVEWVVADKSGNSCPAYPGVEVWPPETTTVFSLPVQIDYSCDFQVHPVMEPDVVPEPDIRVY